MSDFDQFLAIRETYKRILPAWLAEYEATGNMHQDPYFMNWQFTPIEQAVWSDIRTIGIPFYPQVPALNFFLDFANPFLKIGIECDGKAWHDSDLDAKRDEKLAAAGWMIYRIEGHECKRVIEPWTDLAEDEDEPRIYDYFMTTSEGVISAIKHTYFESGPSSYRSKYGYYIDSTLFEHRSTPENDFRKKPRLSGSPALVSDFVQEVLEALKLDQKLLQITKKYGVA